MERGRRGERLGRRQGKGKKRWKGEGLEVGECDKGEGEGVEEDGGGWEGMGATGDHAGRAGVTLPRHLRLRSGVYARETSRMSVCLAARSSSLMLSEGALCRAQHKEQRDNPGVEICYCPAVAFGGKGGAGAGEGGR